MIVAVTGSSGFIGKNLVKRLFFFGHEVLKLDISQGIDILDWEKFKKIKKFDVLVHLAAMSFVPNSYIKPRDFYHLNINGVINGLELCRLYGARFIFTSSYVYGKPEYLPIDENHPLKGFNPYAETKIIGEKICEDYYKYFRVPCMILRPFNIYGNNQNEQFLIPSILKQAKTGKVNLLDPNPKRDFVYIDDVVDAFVKAVENKNVLFDKFNVGTGISYSVGEVVEEVNHLYGNVLTVLYSNIERKSEVLETVANISHINDKLAWYPKIDLKSGLSQLISKQK